MPSTFWISKMYFVDIHCLSWTLTNSSQMRSKPQSFLRHPLSTLLGTDASVRVLRELALYGSALTTTMRAQRTGITDQSVRNVVHALRPTGVLEQFGQGRASAYGLDVEHPLGRALRGLFRAEEERVEAIYATVASAARPMVPPPLAVWVFGSVARHEDRPDSDPDLLLVVAEDGTTERDAGTFRDLLEETERAQQITVSVIPLSGADVVRLAGAGDSFWRELLRDAIVWHGVRPEALAATLARKHRPAARCAGGRGCLDRDLSNPLVPASGRAGCATHATSGATRRNSTPCGQTTRMPTVSSRWPLMPPSPTRTR